MKVRTVRIHRKTFDVSFEDRYGGEDCFEDITTFPHSMGFFHFDPERYSDEEALDILKQKVISDSARHLKDHIDFHNNLVTTLEKQNVNNLR